jgi:hypothetical protein
MIKFQVIVPYQMMVEYSLDLLLQNIPDQKEEM